MGEGDRCGDAGVGLGWVSRGALDKRRGCLLGTSSSLSAPNLQLHLSTLATVLAVVVPSQLALLAAPVSYHPTHACSTREQCLLSSLAYSAPPSRSVSPSFSIVAQHPTHCSPSQVTTRYVDLQPVGMGESSLAIFFDLIPTLPQARSVLCG